MQINNAAIISRRKEYGVSQTSLSQKTGVSVSTISRLEKGENVRFIYVVKVMTVLDLTLEDVIIRLTPAVDTKIIEELDRIRDQSELHLIEDVLKKLTVLEWRSNKKLSVYYDWHKAILYKQEHDYDAALICIERALQRIEDKSSLEYLKASLFMAKGNVQYLAGTSGQKSYIGAGKIYSNNTDKIYYRTGVKLYVNVMAGYFRTKEYDKIPGYAEKAKCLLKKNESTFLLEKIERIERKASEESGRN